MQVPVMNVPVPGLALPLGFSLIARRAWDRQLIEIADRVMGAL
jgi:Asp-tRNA(Asn)/Glu-tRNA(Gln) amidotransferase A subunit family amidase